MLYKTIGVMSGSSLDGVDIVYTHISEKANVWEYKIIACECVAYNSIIIQSLKAAATLSAYDYFKLHASYGKHLGNCIQAFINKHDLAFKIDFITVHGHTVFHSPELGFSTQLGCGANIAAIVQLPVIDNLRNMDIAHGGQGAPIVPIGEQYFFPNNKLFLNIGGIANISYHSDNSNIVAFDVCPANTILNFLAQKQGGEFDTNGNIGRRGKKNDTLFMSLWNEPYFKTLYPKSLSNNLGLSLIEKIQSSSLSTEDKAATYYVFIAKQILNAIELIEKKENIIIENTSLMISGGGAFNGFLIELIKNVLHKKNIVIDVPDDDTIKFKEALIMGLIGVLRWRDSYNVIKSVSGASRSSVNGSMWYANQIEN